jgi:hypothetical protein
VARKQMAFVRKKMTREDCLKWYEGKGFNVPVKSACIGCPFHDDKILD